MAAISLAHVGKRFDTTDVIRDVSLDIADGEFCVLVGPSGSGKSTLLRLIAGLESATAGAVHIGGRDVTNAAPKDRDIAMVFQSYALYPQMTVRENMGFGLKLLKTPKSEIQRRVDEAARMLSLEPLMERRPAALSGGQRQRVAMGRAMVRQPAAFLFDEPLSNLDAALRANVRAEIRAMHQRSKTTSVYVTHDQVEAMTMGDRIVVLRAGQVEQVGTPLALYDQPANRFVAGFIGSPAMNFFELDVVGESTDTHLLLGSGRLPVPAAVVAALAKAGQTRVTVGMRPEHVQLLAHADSQAGAEATDTAASNSRLAGVVKEIEFTGAQSQVSLQTAAGPLLACAAQRPHLKPGDNAQLTVAPQHLHYFDISTGQRLNTPGAAA